MADEESNIYGRQHEHGHTGPAPELMGANALVGSQVRNMQDQRLGTIKEIMLDTHTGKIAYAVLSYGGIFSLGEKLFAVPWNAIWLDAANKRLVLDIDKDRLEYAPGFDASHWPAKVDRAWLDASHRYYGSPVY